MALTAAERAKRYREKIKQNPEEHEKFKKKELERLRKVQKKIKELTDEEKNERRKKWREQKKRQKEKQKTSQPNPQQVAHEDVTTVSKSFQIKHRNLCRNFKTATQKIYEYKKALNNIRKKLYWEKAKHKLEMTSLKAEYDKLQARQELLELSLREAYSDCKKPSDKKVIKKVVLKIGEKTNTKPDPKLLGLKGQIRMRTISKRKWTPVNEKIRSEMEDFFNRDDISRCTVGKKETRTLRKKKMQIRYLVDTLKNLYDI